MLSLALWQGVLLGVSLTIAAALLTVWWRQQNLHWWVMLSFSIVAAIALSWWSGIAFQVADYRSGCDGICPGFRGAPIPFYRGEAAGRELMAGGFLLNSLVYLVLLLAGAAALRTILRRMASNTRWSWLAQNALGLTLVVAPLALSPIVLPPPEAHVRGDPQRIAINARREVYLYDQLADYPILRVGLDDVRPRLDDQPGMRVCLRTYTFFYLPTGSMFLDMTPEGVHSNSGGVLPLTASCWE